ncbi:MAG: extracellular solute-binding protein [Actinomycetaceae bacterium]|nr:extracellular solute-binding protein [Actinomycetaceae bacterium]
MQLSRRDALKAAALFGTLSAGLGLAGCSSAPGGSSQSGAMTIWMWPSGFSKPCLTRAQKKFPNLKVSQNIIGGDFKQKLTTTFSAKTGLPPITGVKGEDMPFFRDKPDYFVDLNELGFDKLAGSFLDWKIKQAQAKDGRQIGFPMDIGPTVTFYRFDVFDKAGLPTAPDAVAERVHTWPDYFRLGEDLLKALPGHYLIRNAASVFQMSTAQQELAFVSEDNSFIGDQPHIRQCWDLCIDALNRGIVAKIQSNTPDIQAMVNEGTLPADFGASWHLDDLQGDAPDTSGKWHITQCPGGASNLGGSFLTIPAGTENAKEAFEVMSYLMDAEGQAIEYTEKGHFPSAHAALDMDALQGEVAFLGGQRAIEVFKPAAESVKEQYIAPTNDAVSAPFFTELGQVEASGKNADKAFDDAVAAAKKLAGQLGVNVK